MILALLYACATEATEACDPEGVTWDTFTAGFVSGRCQACHGVGSTDRHGAPEAIHFEDQAETSAQLDLVRDSVLVRGSMPPAGGLTDAELEHLAHWLDCPE